MLYKQKRPHEKVLYMRETDVAEDKSPHPRSKQWQKITEAFMLVACYALYSVVPMVLFGEALFLSRVCVCTVRAMV